MAKTNKTVFILFRTMLFTYAAQIMYYSGNDLIILLLSERH